MTDTASPLPFTLSSHDDAPTRGGSLLATMPCYGSLDLRFGCCMDVMATFPDGYFDLAIVDPPYGIGAAEDKRGGQQHGKAAAPSKSYGAKMWDSGTPPTEYFDELRRVSKHQIIWGANHMMEKIMRGSPSWIIWDKQNGDNGYADAELAYTSHDKAARVFRFRWAGMLQGDMANKEERIHPTQKPVRLYDWLLANYAAPGMRVLDTHLGSGSHAIAAHYAGVHLTACEIDGDYFHAAKARIDRETSQAQLFSPHNVKEHATLSVGASVDHGVEVETTGEHENRAADRGCCVSTCSIFFFHRRLRIWDFFCSNSSRVITSRSQRRLSSSSVLVGSRLFGFLIFDPPMILDPILIAAAFASLEYRRTLV